MTNSNSRNTLSDSDIFPVAVSDTIRRPAGHRARARVVGKFADLASRAENPCRRVGVATLDVSRPDRWSRLTSPRYLWGGLDRCIGVRIQRTSGAP